MWSLEAIVGVWLAIALRITIGIVFGSLIVGVVTRLFPKIPAEARHGLWLLVLLQGLLWFRIPVWLPAPSPPVGEVAVQTASPPVAPALPRLDARFEAALPSSMPQAASTAVAAVDRTAIVTETHAVGIWRELANRWKPVLAIGWLIGAVLLTGLLALRFWRFHSRAMSGVSPASQPLQLAAQRLARQHGIRRAFRVVESERCDVPMLVGLLRPAVILPRSLAALPAEQSEPLLAHEMAHLARWDRPLVALSLFSCVLNYFNPFAWWARTRMSTAREESADRWVTQIAGYSPKSYGRGLLAVAEGLTRPQTVCLGVGRRPSELRRRVESLQEFNSGQSRGHLWPARVLSAAVVLAVLVSLVSVRQGTPAPAEAQPAESADAVASVEADDTGSSTDQPAQPQRVLHFPSDWSMGTVHIQDPRDDSRLEDWKYLDRAIGDVRIPVGNEVLLAVKGEEAFKDLSPLRQLEPNDVQRIWFGGSVDDEDLANITHLTGLKSAAFGGFGGRSPSGAAVARLAKTLSLERLSLDGRTFGHEDVAHLTSLDSLKSLGLQGSGVTDKALAHVGKMTFLESLDLWGGNLTDEGLAQLKGLKSLERLNLSKTPIRGAGLAHLADLPNLTHLDLSATSIGDDGWAHLGNLTNLESLSMGSTSVGDDDLAHLAKMQKLRQLALGGAQVSAAGIAHLSPLKSLEILRLPKGIAYSDATLEHLGQISSLRKLSPAIGKSPVTDRGLVQLSKLQKLETLDIYCRRADSSVQGVSDRGIAHIGEMKGLKSLKLRGPAITGKGLAHLANLQQLEQLWVLCEDAGRGNSADTDESAQQIAKLASLNKLVLSGTSMTGKGLARLARLSALEELTLVNNQVTWEGLRHLGAFAGLRKLVLDGVRGETPTLHHLRPLTALTTLTVDVRPARCSDDVLADVSTLSQLTHFALSGVAMTNQGIEHLAGLTSLQQLSLDGPSMVTDDGLRHLANMQKLYRLYLQGPFTDRGLEQLASLESLHWLYLDGSGRTISKTGIKKLRHQRPGLVLWGYQYSKYPAQVGKTAPDFEVQTFQGRTIRLKDLRGRPVLLCFWGAWSSPAVEDVPKLKKLHEELTQKYEQFEMIGLSFDKDRQQAQRYVAEHAMTWPQAWVGIDSPIWYAYEIPGFPTYFVIRPDGTIGYVARDLEMMEEAVAIALAPTETGKPRNPFGLEADVPVPDGVDVKRFAAEVELTGEENYLNVRPRSIKATEGKRGSLDGQWLANTNVYWAVRTVEVKTVDDWVYILLRCEPPRPTRLIQARRHGNRLLGRWVTVDASRYESLPWVGLVVGDEWIDGAFPFMNWGQYPLDFWRKLKEE